MRPAIAILCLLLAGCASTIPTPAPAPAMAMASAEAFPTIPVDTNVQLSAPQLAQQPPPAAVPVDLPAFIYPADASNHVWKVQESPDLVSWTNYAGPFYGQPGGSFTISNAASPSFWRMEADQ
ncbi:MAG: hypothetical protein ABSE16_08415 [Verrucomicrobiota bacterium]|jgi:hypothetical protein